MSDQRLRTAREALLAELMGDMDQLLDRQEASAKATTAAAERLEAATMTLTQATAASVEAAKASVGEYITRRVNETTDQAVHDARKAIDEAIAAALGKALLAAQQAGPVKADAAAKPTGRLAWWAFGAGFVASAICAGIAWLIAR